MVEKLFTGELQFYTNSYAFVSVLLIILDLAILGAMLRVAHKSTATRFLIVFFLCLLFNSLAMFWSNAGPVYRFVFIPTQDAFLITGGIGLIGFAYHYPHCDQPREAKLMLAIFSTIALAAFAYNFYFAYTLISYGLAINPPFYFSLLMPLSLLVGILVFLWRAVHFAGPFSQRGLLAVPLALQALWRPPNPSVLALRNFALALAVGSIQAVASAGFVTGTLNIHFIAIGAILAISAITLAYVNYAPEPISFMVKVVGISLVTVLTVLGITGVNLIETYRAERLQLLQIKADLALTTVLQYNHPGLVPAEVRYIAGWPGDDLKNEAAYQIYFKRDNEPLATPAAIAAENLASLAQDVMPQPANPGETNFMGRALLPSPVDYTRIMAVQLWRGDRVYEVGFLNADNILFPVHRQVMQQIFLVVVSSLFVIILFPLFFRRTLLAPLRNLLHGIEQTNVGRLDLTLPVKYEDELGFLTRSFNRMVGSLRESQQSLQELNRNLEQRVTERTTELTAANKNLENQNRRFQYTNQKLAHEIGERARAELQAQRQLEYVRALSACSQTLLSAASHEANQQALLVEAMNYLIKPVQASEIFLYENFDHPELGFCSRLVVQACAPGIPPALEALNGAILPWADVPNENRCRLAAGEPVGGPVQKLFAGTPSIVDYLLNKVHVLSAQLFPIHLGEYWWGYVGFADRVNEREWLEEEILLLGAAAKMLSNTLQRWQAEARERRQRQIAESLQEVALILNRSLDQKQVVTTILNQLQRVINYDGAAIWQVDAEELVIIEAVGISCHRIGAQLALAHNNPQTLAVRNRQPQIIADVANLPDWPDLGKKAGIRSWMGMPLLAGQKIMGLLSLVQREPNAYTQEDLQVLQSFASQAVTAMSNAELYQRVNTARERLSILYRASQLISAASLVPQRIYAEIHAAVAQLMHADVFIVTLINEAEPKAEDIYLVNKGQVCPGQTYPLPGSFAHYLLRRDVSLRIDDYAAILLEEFEFNRFAHPADTRSGLGVLLRGHNRVMGMLSVHSYELAAYTDDDLEMLDLLATHAAIALENTWLHQQAQTAAAVEERNRLARDLHDSVTQSLYSLTLLAEGRRRLAQRGLLADLDGALTELGEIAQQSLKEMRLLIYELRPPVLEQAGLLGALRQRLGTVERRAGIEARLIAAELIKLPPQVEQGFYRITQEALNNALKHAKATAVTVFVRASGEWIEVEVNDNGCGFDIDRLNGQRGLGLNSMRERAEQLGGELVIESKPGQGTTVKARVKGNPGELPGSPLTPQAWS